MNRESFDFSLVNKHLKKSGKDNFVFVCDNAFRSTYWMRCCKR